MRGSQLVVIDAVDEGAIDIVAAGRGNDDLLRAAGNVRAGLGLAGEEAGRLQHDIDAEIAPRQFRRITFGQHLDAIAIDDQVAAIDTDLARETSMRGVVLGQVRIGRRVAEIIHRDDLDLAGALCLVQCAQHVATDTTVTIDGDLDRHCTLLDAWERKGSYCNGPASTPHSAIRMDPLERLTPRAERLDCLSTDDA